MAPRSWFFVASETRRILNGEPGTSDMKPIVTPPAALLGALKTCVSQTGPRMTTGFPRRFAAFESKKKAPPSLGGEDLVALVVRGAFAFSRMSDRVEQKKASEDLVAEVFFRRDVTTRAETITAFRSPIIC